MKRGPRRTEDTQPVRAIALLFAMARSRRGISLKQFAAARGYPLSGVYRDRDVLARVGVPIEQPEHGRYRVPPAWIPPSAAGATHDEMLALFVARRLAPGLRGTRFGRQLDSLWAKLAAPGGQTPLTFPDETGLSTPALAAIDYAPHAVVVDLLTAAVRDRRAVHIRYRRPDGEETERVIEPGFLHWDGRLETLYVPSWCRLREAVRVFAVHRICEARLTDDTFAPRRETRRAALEKAFQIWMRDHTERVSIRFSPRIAGEIRERRRHASQRLSDTPDGGVLLELEVAEPEEMTRWILGFGPDAQVLEPARLADRIRALHGKAAALPASGATTPLASTPRATTQAALREAPAAAARRSKG